MWLKSDPRWPAKALRGPFPNPCRGRSWVGWGVNQGSPRPPPPHTFAYIHKLLLDFRQWLGGTFLGWGSRLAGFDHRFLGHHRSAGSWGVPPGSCGAGGRLLLSIGGRLGQKEGDGVRLREEGRLGETSIEYDPGNLLQNTIRSVSGTSTFPPPLSSLLCRLSGYLRR